MPGSREESSVAIPGRRRRRCYCWAAGAAAAVHMARDCTSLKGPCQCGVPSVVAHVIVVAVVVAHVVVVGGVRGRVPVAEERGGCEGCALKLGTDGTSLGVLEIVVDDSVELILENALMESLEKVSMSRRLRKARPTCLSAVEGMHGSGWWKRV
ncbi:hypothetical protein EDB89DRAFT_1910755 [Lactarius sanguifluus]|nr:hypothetical protein EDB89DRAFT_1910755 [Lactarius sanguifluus]